MSFGHRVLPWAFGVLLLMSGAAAAAGQEHAHEDGPVIHATPLCHEPIGWNIDPAEDGSPKPPARWLHQPAVNDAYSSLAHLVWARPDLFLGIVPDRSERHLILLTNPSRHEHAVEATVLEVNARRGAVAVEIRPGCRDRAELEDLLDTARSSSELASIAEELDGSERAIGFGYSIDEVTGRAVVWIPFSAREDAESVLQAQFGEAIVVKRFRLMSRTNDGSPHYGGAQMGPYGYSNDYCTAGPAVDNASGRWLVTAQHCTDYPMFDEGEIIEWWSGSTQTWFGEGSTAWDLTGRATTEYLNAGGTSQFRGDVSMIGDGTDQYSRYIHVDPCCPTTRLVNGKANPTASTTGLCVTGSRTRARCSLDVFDVSLWYPPEPEGPWVAYHAERPNVQIVAHGDSGAPIYKRSGSSNATIYGMAFAADSEQGQEVGDGWDSVIFTPTYVIEDELGVTIATSCCNNDSW